MHTSRSLRHDRDDRRQIVEQTNETGELVLRVKLSEEVCPGMVLSYKGRWPKRENKQANVNTLNPGKKADMGESTAVHGVEVAVTPVRKDKSWQDLDRQNQ